MGEEQFELEAGPEARVEARFALLEAELEAERRNAADWKLRYEVLQEQLPRMMMAAMFAARMDLNSGLGGPR